MIMYHTTHATTYFVNSQSTPFKNYIIDITLSSVFMDVRQEGSANTCTTFTISVVTTAIITVTIFTIIPTKTIDVVSVSVLVRLTSYQANRLVFSVHLKNICSYIKYYWSSLELLISFTIICTGAGLQTTDQLCISAVLN